MYKMTWPPHWRSLSHRSASGPAPQSDVDLGPGIRLHPYRLPAESRYHHVEWATDVPGLRDSHQARYLEHVWDTSDHEPRRRIRKKPGSFDHALGTIVNMYRLGVKIHENTIRSLHRGVEEGKVPRLFRAFIPYGSAIEEAAEFVATNTLKQRWRPTSLYGQLQDLTLELTERAEAQL